MRGRRRLRRVPIIGLSALVVAGGDRARPQAGFHDFVAKFDRRGLIAALKEQTAGAAGAAELSRAAA